VASYATADGVGKARHLLIVVGPGYHDRVGPPERWLRSGLAILLATGCAAGNLSSNPPGDDSIGCFVA
jgi:hypothetical protein